LNLIYQGQSKKHAIFRAKGWDKKLERVLKKPIFSEEYDKIGKIHDIFGPVKVPFISVKIDKENFNPQGNFYVKLI